MKNLLVLLFPFILVSCGEAPAKTADKLPKPSSEEPRKEISEVLDQWHSAAGNANFEDYFWLMAEDAVFIGTDATENWRKPEFKEWAKPYFDRGQAWDFTSLERNIYLSENNKEAWFDELLDTQMGVCRGSGVMVKVDGDWKVQHYVLSMAIPNEKGAEVTALKKNIDDNIISILKSN